MKVHITVDNSAVSSRKASTKNTLCVFLLSNELVELGLMPPSYSVLSVDYLTTNVTKLGRL